MIDTQELDTWCKQTNFQTRLKAFTHAAADLLDAWNEADHTGAYFIDGYPFDRSLEDVVRDVIEWRDKQTQPATD